MDIASEKSKVYVVSVGGYEIARADFDTEITVAKKKYEKLYGDDVFMSAQGDTLMGKLKAQVISRLIEEGVFMQEISRSGYKVSDDKVEDELKKFYETSGKSEETFRKTLDETGYSYDYFKNKFVTRVLINSYIDERVLAEAFNQFEKQNLFNAWFENSKVLAEVVYYDKGLENLIRNQSASGGSCSAN
ncbi:SurA N-terminal domain-containing protein [Thermodesulfobacteriota bacterium]